MSDTQQARRFILTINNPTQTDEELNSYIESLEHFKYSCWQREKGEKTGTEHIQMFIIFSIGKRFATIKSYFPTAHIEKVRGSNSQARDYCSKSETRVSGPYELGTFAEERGRSDIKEFLECIDAGLTNIELKALFPTLFLKSYDKIERLRQEKVFNDYKNRLRSLDVTYIYGCAGSGKTSYVVNKYGLENIYRVTNYDKGLFDAYAGQNVLVFDEFNSQIKIEPMLNYLDIYPLQLPCRYNDKVACFEKVYIISNFSIDKQYMKEQQLKEEQYNAFMRRIHTIMKIENRIPKIERQTMNGVQINILSSEDIEEVNNLF